MESWWRTMRIRQTKMFPLRNWLRPLPRTAQLFARSAEPGAAACRFYYAQLRKRLYPRGTTDLKLARLPPCSPLPVAALPSVSLIPSARLHRCHGLDIRASIIPSSFGIRSFGIFPTFPTESSPQTISPGDPATAGPLDSNNHPVMDGHGNWSAPDNNQTNN